ncbi:unnamed protein product [Closterium sp. Yama58-4]|nr:unnamed protein product [Closterium sp. Yama58-4]
MLEATWLGARGALGPRGGLVGGVGMGAREGLGASGGLGAWGGGGSGMGMAVGGGVGQEDRRGAEEVPEAEEVLGAEEGVGADIGVGADEGVGAEVELRNRVGRERIPSDVGGKEADGAYWAESIPSGVGGKDTDGAYWAESIPSDVGGKEVDGAYWAESIPSDVGGKEVDGAYWAESIPSDSMSSVDVWGYGVSITVVDRNSVTAPSPNLPLAAMDAPPPHLCAINDSRNGTLNSLALCTSSGRDAVPLPEQELVDRLAHAESRAAQLAEQGYGERHTASLPHLLASFFIQMAAQEDLWTHSLCARVYEGKWITRDFPQENHVTVMAIEDFYHRASNCARTVRPKEFTIFSAAFSRAAHAVMDAPCPPFSLSSASSLADLLFGFSPVIQKESDYHRSANMHRSDNRRVPAAATAAPLHGAWAVRHAPVHDHHTPTLGTSNLWPTTHAPHASHIAARSYAVPHNLPAGAVLLQQHGRCAASMINHELLPPGVNQSPMWCATSSCKTSVGSSHAAANGAILNEDPGVSRHGTAEPSYSTMWGTAFPAILGGTIFYVAKRLAFPRKASSLEWEGARRKARQPHKRAPSFYASHGVTSVEEYIINARGVVLFTKQWLPRDGPLRGVVVGCHGYGETCTYIFEDVAVKLARAGYALVGVDYEGHGLSAGRHGYIRSFPCLVDDVIEVARRAKANPRFAHLPFFVYGESMGGAVAIQVARRDASLWNGAIVVAPMCKVSKELTLPRPMIFIFTCLAHVFPTWKLLPVSANAGNSFKVAEKRERADSHPFAYHDPPRLGTALQLYRTTLDICAHMEEVTVPLLILQGTEDRVVDIAAVRDLFIRARSTDKEMKVYEGSWHALTCGEPDDVVAKVVHDVCNWLHARSLPPSAVVPVDTLDGTVPPVKEQTNGKVKAWDVCG